MVQRGRGRDGLEEGEDEVKKEGGEGGRKGGREGGRDKPWFSVEDGAMDLRKREMRYWIALSKV